ncbi:hypothetical protein T484DRAFT_1767756 [Baffinella frigidus]|nr:hypothetical protein T484DRAFT_1767756 [Cryptophyta sp. CCMP2293]
MRRQASVSKQLSHLQEFPPTTVVCKMPSGGGEFVERAASLHADHGLAARCAFVPFQISLDRNSTRRSLSILATNFVEGSPAKVTRQLDKYGQRVQRSWVGKVIRALMGEDGSQSILDVPVESAALEELLKRAAEEDRCAEEVMTNSKISWRPPGPSPVPRREHLRFEQEQVQEKPRGPRGRDTSEELVDEARTFLVEEDPVCAVEALAESDRLLNEASSICTPRPSGRPGRVALLIKDAHAMTLRGATVELRELVRMYSFGSPHASKRSLELHVEEGIFVVRVTGEGLPRNNACVYLAGLAAHASISRTSYLNHLAHI